MTAGEAPRARIYLLRCWREGGAHRPPDDGRRFSLEDPHSGRRRGFASLAALVAALEAALPCGEDEPGPGGAAPDRGPPG
jgi:hypothetical protein